MRWTKECKTCRPSTLDEGQGRSEVKKKNKITQEEEEYKSGSLRSTKKKGNTHKGN